MQLKFLYHYKQEIYKIIIDYLKEICYNINEYKNIKGGYDEQKEMDT